MIKQYAEFSVRIFGRLVPSKATLRRALKDSPDAVVWQEISTVGNSMDERVFTTSELLAEGLTTITLVGPDPYRSRKWFGSLTLGKVPGTVKVT